MNEDIYDLRTALSYLKEQGEEVVLYEKSIDTKYEIARHYVEFTAGVPASSESREERIVLYNNVKKHDIPVLMGVLGSRKRNQLLLTGKKECHHDAFKKALKNRKRPVKINKPVCQQVRKIVLVIESLFPNNVKPLI